MLAADTARARAYLDLLVRSSLAPKQAIVTDPGDVIAATEPTETPLFDNLTPLTVAMEQASVPYTLIPTADINHEEVVRAVSSAKADVVVFAGPAGAIVKAPLFATGKQFLHVHPGRLPSFRGSTPMYYTLLAEGTLEATAIMLSEDIDHGPIVARRVFSVPDDPSSIDLDYDPWMRATLLAEVIERFAREGHLPTEPQDPSAGQTYYVIHPVLKHLAILGAAARSRA